MNPGFVLACLVALVLVPALWRGTRLREAVRLVLSAPAWLVPAAFAVVVMVVWRCLNLEVVENPWVANDVAGSLALSVTMAAGLAGQIGLLRAHGEGRVGSSGDFWRGIQDHTLAVLAGKLLLGGGTALMLSFLPRGWQHGPLGILYLVPNILLAALVGTAAMRPREVFRPLRLALEVGIRDTGKVAVIVIAHATLVVALFELFAVRHGVAAMLGPFASSLGYGVTPPMWYAPSFAKAVAWLALSAVGSSICITAMVLGVTRGFDAKDAAADARKAAPTPAAGTDPS